MRISENGQITIPKPLRDRFGLSKGVEVEFTATERGLLICKSPTGQRPVERISGILEANDIVKDVDSYIEDIRGR